MNTTKPKMVYVFEFTEDGNPDQERGGMPFYLSVQARSEAQARKHFAEHMSTEHPGTRFTIQQVGLSAFPRPDAVGKRRGC
jgi:hypothetical protein